MSDIKETAGGPVVDFSQIGARVLEHLNSIPEQSATPQAPSETPPQHQAAAQEQPPAGTPAARTDEAPSEFTLPDGTKATAEEILQWRKGNMLQSDYTRKTQEVAQMRQAAEEVFKAYQTMEQERAELIQFLNNPQEIVQYLAQQYGGQQAQQFNPDMVPTLGDVQQLTQREIARIQQQMADMQQQFQAELQRTAAQTRERIAYEAQEAEYANQIEGEFSKIFDQYPILKAIPNAEHSIRLEVFQKNPESDEAMFEALWEAAQRHADTIEQTYVNQNKARLTRAESLQTNNTQPPGGQGLQPEPARSRYSAKENKIDFKSVYKDAVSYLQTRQ